MNKVFHIEIIYNKEQQDSEAYIERQLIVNQKLVFKDYSQLPIFITLDDPIVQLVNYASGFNNEPQKSTNVSDYIRNAFQAIKLRWFKFIGKYKKFSV